MKAEREREREREQSCQQIQNHTDWSLFIRVWLLLGWTYILQTTFSV